ncbi:MAG: PAS domain S-box protein [Cyanobacteria bacterium P01_F01_bin.3]
MQPTHPANSEAAVVSPVIDPLAVYQALWQDEKMGHAVLTTSGESFYCLNVNEALKKSPIWQIVDPRSPVGTVTGENNPNGVLDSYIQQFQQHCEQCADTQQTVSFELFFPMEDGVNQWWQLRLNPVESGASVYEKEQHPQLVLTASDISELRQAEHNLKDAVQDVRTVLDNIQELVLIHDTSGKILDVNENVLTLHGITREQALHYSIGGEYAIPETPVHLLPMLWERTLNGERVAVEWPACRACDGERLMLDVVLQKVVLSGQDRVIACIRDVTAQKRLEEDQNRLLAILEATQDLVGMADAEGNSLYLNQAGQQAFGIPAEEIDSFHISEVLPTWARAHFFETAVSHAVAQGSWSGEQMLVNRAGEEFPVSIMLNAHKDAAGEFRYISAIMRDMSEFKAVEAALREQQQFLDSIYRGANVVMFAWDVVDEATRELRCSGWNPACVDATGMSEETVIGRTPIEVFGPESGAAVVERQFQCIAQQQPIEYEEKIVFEDSSATWWTTKLNPIRDESGRIYRIVGTTTDITDTKLHTIELEAYSKLQAQQAQALQSALSELKRTQAQVVHSEKMSSLGQMVAGIAHEINNPVNFIHANIKPASTYAAELLELIELYQEVYPQPVPAVAEMIEDLDLEFVQKDFVELLDSMKIGTQRIREIVLSLRNFSRLDEAEVKAVNLHDGIDSTLVILSHKLKANLIQKPVQVTKSYQLLPLVECYPSQLNQVVMNILANAIDALGNSENPSIRIATQGEGDRAIITISDNGQGIPDAVKANIFDPFFTTKPVGKGTGMGLSISHQIVTERHGGSLSVDSRPGEGTTFVITIPLRQTVNR